VRTFLILVAVVNGFLCVNMILGVVVLSTLDRDGRLLAWFKEAPRDFGGLIPMLALQCWPWIAWAYRTPPKIGGAE
jgi:hypothetical protein